MLRIKKRNTFRIAAFITMIMFLVSCGGRAANPIMAQQFGDEKKSCKALEMEMAQIQQEIQLLTPKTHKAGKNTLLGVAGFFLIVPFFFMDLSKAEQIEINAFRQRYNHLVIIATEKDCGHEAKPIPAFDKKPKADVDEEDDN